MKMPRLTEVFKIKEDYNLDEDGTGGLGGTTGAEDSDGESSEEEMNLAGAE